MKNESNENLIERGYMDKQLKYPVGCKIRWCYEEFEVIENYNDHSGTVTQGDDIITNFYFSYQGEEAIVIRSINAFIT